MKTNMGRPNSITGKLLASIAVVVILITPVLLVIYTGLAELKLDAINIFVAILLMVSLIAGILSVFGIDLKVTSKTTDDKINNYLEALSSSIERFEWPIFALVIIIILLWFNYSYGFQ